MKIKEIEKFEADKPYDKTRIYVWPDNESIIDNINKRRERPYTVYKKEIIPQVLAKYGWSLTTKIRWSQKAGCPCGCSPGFIVSDHYGEDIHVTI